MGIITKTTAFRPRRHRCLVGRLVLLCALALSATACAGVTNVSHRVESATRAVPVAQASEGKFVGLYDVAVEVEALPPLEAKAAGAEIAATTPGKPTGAIMAELALAEVSDEELDDMRGGIVFNAGIVIEFTIEFVTHIDGVLVDPAATIGNPATSSGIVTRVVDGVPTVIGTNDFTGIISLVQNSLDFQNIRNATIVHADMFGVLTAVRGSLLRSQLNFGAAAGL